MGDKLLSSVNKLLLEMEIIIVLLQVVALEISVLLNFIDLKYGMHFITRLVLSTLTNRNPEAFFYVFVLFLLWDIDLYNLTDWQSSNDYTVAFDGVVIATSITIILTGNCIGLLTRTVTYRAWSVLHDLVVFLTVLLLAGVITIVFEVAIVILIPSMVVAFLTSTLRLSLNYSIRSTDLIVFSICVLCAGGFLLLYFAAGNVLLKNYENFCDYLDSTLISMCISYYYGMDFSESTLKYILRKINPNPFFHSKFTYTGVGYYYTVRDYGLEIYFPPTSHIKRGIDITVKVRAADESFQIRNGLELVSAIYNISTSRSLPVEAVLRIQHSVPGYMVTSGRLTFVCARNGPPYQFQQIDGGMFSQDSSYGLIKVSEFSEFGIAWLLRGWRQPHAPTNLVVGVYSYGTTASFVATRNLAAHLRDVEDVHNGRTDKSTIVAIDGNLDEIKLALPVKRKGWEITSTFNPAVITLEAIRDFQPGKAIPRISLEMEWLRLNEPVKPTDIKVKVLGLKNLLDFKLPCGRKCVMPIFNQQNSSDDEIQTASCLTAIFRYLKPNIQRRLRHVRLNLDNDFLFVHHLLSGLNKEQLKYIGIHLGLAHDTVNNYYDSSADRYCSEMLRAWISERDNVIEHGGATWQNLKKALQAEGLNGHAEKIEPLFF